MPSTPKTDIVNQHNKATYTVLGGGVNDSGWWMYRLKNNKSGRETEKSRKAVAVLRRAGRIIERCSCPTGCDCQNPEPVSGAALVSNECPIHNWNPAPSPHCRVHTGLTRD